MQMRKVLGSIYTDEDFADLFPKEGQPAEAPWRLALVTVMQFVENLSDQQAANAVRGRIDWKYVLGLERDLCGLRRLHPLRIPRTSGRTPCAICACWRRCSPSLDKKAGGTARGRQRTDSTHVLGKIRALNRVLCVWETMRAAKSSLAVVAPDWLRARLKEEWVERYGPRSEDSRLPAGEMERKALARSDWRAGKSVA
jgi:transposase